MILSMDEIEIKLVANPYSVYVGTGWMELLPPFVEGQARVPVVSDRNVWRLYGEGLKNSEEVYGLPELVPVLIQPGESHKNMKTLEKIFAAFAENELDRSGCVLAFGGGVVGDIAGFAAACWMRGVRYIQIPTTLLAMVDSSVGGKTAIDIQAGKNLVGAFHQPSLVLANPALLRTLPPLEFQSGMAEVIKTAVLSSEELCAGILSMEPGVVDPELECVIRACVRFKGDVVAQDEHEGGLRKILNFGHTFGHAIEAKYGFKKYTHGQAVAAGMRIAARYGEGCGISEKGISSRIEALLKRHGLLIEEDAVDLIPWIRNDKKTHGEAIDLVLLKYIGEPVVIPTPFSELERTLKKMFKK